MAPQRGRPRKYSKETMETFMRIYECTPRSAQNNYRFAHAMKAIGVNCSEDTQRWFFGGRTYNEVLADSAPKKFCEKRLIMQELGRHPFEDIPEIADMIANNGIPELDLSNWTQAGIVRLLKDSRIGDQDQ